MAFATQVLALPSASLPSMIETTDEDVVEEADGGTEEAEGDTEEEEEEEAESDRPDRAVDVRRLLQAQLPYGGVFRALLGQSTMVQDVWKLLPTLEVPFSKPVRFSTRLGLFLSDGARLEAGDYPHPDGGFVTVFPFAIASDGETSFYVHARPNFHGRRKHSFVEVSAADEEKWYGCVWLLFHCKYRGVDYNLALVSWLTARSGAPFATRKPTFAWTSQHLDCVEVGHISRLATMVQTCIRRTPADANVYHLVD